jgi:mRNA interferase HigB
MKLISNKALRDFAAVRAEAEQPLQEFRVRWERSECRNFAELRALFPGVDKVGPVFVFNIGGNKFRLVAGLSFQARRLWVKAVLTHREYDKEKWK